MSKVLGDKEVETSPKTAVWQKPYLEVPLNKPDGGTTPDGAPYTYSANDASIGDLDGDGEYEIVLKWDPSNSKDNAHNGYTGEVIIDAYKLDGTFMWRVHLGKNIRAGAHYTQLMVYDLDGDGKAEIAMKTADGTVDGTGRVIGDQAADYINEDGRILAGPEYLSIFHGETGRNWQPWITIRRAEGLRTGEMDTATAWIGFGRHRLFGRRKAEPCHGPRLLHKNGASRLQLPRRQADQAVDV